MKLSTYFIYLLVMVAVTYLVRVLPYVCMKKEVKNKFFRSFLAYIPYTVLAAMTIPAILSATSCALSAVIGLIVAVVAGYFEQGLLKVALFSCAAVLVTEWILTFS